MRLLCPHCGKAHIIRDGALGLAGRMVRCSVCKSTWFADAHGEAKTPAHAYEGADPHALIERVRKATAYKPLKSKKPDAGQEGLRFAIEPGTAILGAFALFLVSGLIFREPVVKAMPNLASLYQSIGLPVNVRGLEFAEITSSRAVQNGEPVLVIEGKITNISKGEVAVPAVRVTLRSPSGGEIDAVTARPEIARLDQTGETTFKTTLANPPSDAKDVLVHFSDPQNLGS
jgi:predicted Zn finger-like uncharacterized protein